MQGAKAAYARTDVRQRDDLRKLVKLACDRYGKPGCSRQQCRHRSDLFPSTKLRVEDWEDMIDVNIKGVLYGIAAALRVFPRPGFSGTSSTHRVHCSSSDRAETWRSMPAQRSPYAPSAKALRQEAGDKLRVTVISPRLHSDKLHGIHDGPAGEGPDRRIHGQVRDAAECDRPAPSRSRSSSRRMLMWVRLLSVSTAQG